MLKPRSIVLVCFLLIFSPWSVWPQWAQTNGPGGGTVNCLSATGISLFAGTTIGVYVSTNIGTSWTAVNTGLTSTQVYALAASGSNLFAGTGGGVFLSTNNGTGWAEVDSGLTNTSVRSLAVIGTNLFAGTSGGGVFLSANNGTSWTAVNTGLTSTHVYALTASGTNLFAGTDGGVYLSTDNGLSWTAINTGLTNSFVRALAVSTTALFAGTNSGVYVSTNNGTSWRAFNTGWTSPTVRAFAASSTILFAGTDGGVFLSNTNDTSWTAENTGLTSTSVYALAFSGTNLVAGTASAGAWRRPLSEMLMARLGLNKQFISFGNIKAGQYKDTTVTVTNSGTDTLNISSITSSRSTFTAKPTAMKVAPSQSSMLTLRFAPLSVGADSALLVIQSNASSLLDTVQVSGVGIASTGVEVFLEMPTNFALMQNYPNPFNPSTTLRYGLPDRSSVRIVITNTLGQQVAVLENGEREAGYHEVEWRATAASGIYFYRIEAVGVNDPNNRFVQVKKMLLLK